MVVKTETNHLQKLSALNPIIVAFFDIKSLFLLNHQIIRSDMVAIFWAQSDARSVVQPQPPLLRLFHGHFKPLVSP